MADEATEDDGADVAAVDAVGGEASKTISHSPPRVLVGTESVHAVLLGSRVNALSAAAGGPPPPKPAPYPGIPGWLNSMPSVSVENTHTAPNWSQKFPAGMRSLPVAILIEVE